MGGVGHHYVSDHTAPRPSQPDDRAEGEPEPAMTWSVLRVVAVAGGDPVVLRLRDTHADTGCEKSERMKTIPLHTVLGLDLAVGSTDQRVSKEQVLRGC
jgi:hypothetical protein